jgi:hypothetical protein
MYICEINSDNKDKDKEDDDNNNKGGHQCGFRSNRKTTDQIFCIQQIVEKNGSAMRQYISYS